MKKEYKELELEIIEFSTEDIITSSNCSTDGNQGGNGETCDVLND